LPLSLPAVWLCVIALLLTAGTARAGTATFLHRATTGNITANWTFIDDAPINLASGDLLEVTPNWNPGGGAGVYDKHPIGVWYTSGHWAIYNQDKAAMPVGAAFNVAVNLDQPFIFLHSATKPGSITNNWTLIDNSVINTHPEYPLVVTPNWNPNGAAGGVYDNHPIGVWYTNGQWAIYNQDKAPMPTGAAFNVSCPHGAVVHHATAGNTAGNSTTIDNVLAGNNPNALLLVTANWNPGGGGTGIYDSHPIGVWFTPQGHWAIFNQDMAAMPAGAAFNIKVLP